MPTLDDSQSSGSELKFGLNSRLLFDDVMKTDSKRGWEPLPPLTWVKPSPKRAFEVVHRLWNDPEIRRQYRLHLRNGKRSKEQLIDIPVQSEHTEPAWMIDEIEYHPEMPLADFHIERNAGKGHTARREQNGVNDFGAQKRFWEDIIFKDKRKFQDRQTRKDRELSSDKRAWEIIELKRTFPEIHSEKPTVADRLDEDSEASPARLKLMQDVIDDMYGQLQAQDMYSYLDNVAGE